MIFYYHKKNAHFFMKNFKIYFFVATEVDSEANNQVRYGIPD